MFFENCWHGCKVYIARRKGNHSFENNIKQIENLENVGDVKTFVIEGAEAGGQIEYYYILRKEFNPYGGFYVQDETPRANVEVTFALS